MTHRVAKLNYKFQSPDSRDVKYQHLTNLPVTSKSLRGKMPEVKNQGELGSCVSNSATLCIEFCLSKEDLPAPPQSRLYLYFFGRMMTALQEDPNATPEEIQQYINTDSGLEIRTAFKTLLKYKCCPEKLCPYDISKFTVKPDEEAIKNATLHQIKYLAVDQSLDGIKSCIVEGFPVTIGIQVFESFMSEDVAKTGDVPMPDVDNEQCVGGHCLTLVGFDDVSKKFLIQNSWGTAWGDKGFCTIPYDYILNTTLASDFWTTRYFK
jgi:hypothetical protein